MQCYERLAIVKYKMFMEDGAKFISAKTELKPSVCSCNGIISHLTRVCNGNVHKKGVVIVTASGTEIGQPHYVVKRRGHKVWISAAADKVWIMFDFGEHNVHVNSYIIRSIGDAYPSKWIMAGSDDREIWVRLDRRTHVHADGNDVSRLFSAGTRRGQQFRFIGIMRTSKTPKKLVISEIEFFGTVQARRDNMKVHVPSLRPPKEMLNNGDQVEIEMNGKRKDLFNGIITYMSRLYDGNLDDKRVMSITASSSCSGEYCVLDREHNRTWSSRDQERSWITFDFHEKSVCPTHYSLICRNTNLYPKAWNLSGSESGNCWKLLDTQNTKLLKSAEGHVFMCAANGKAFRFLRIEQTGQNGGRTSELGISEVEFFGTLTVRVISPAVLEKMRSRPRLKTGQPLHETQFDVQPKADKFLGIIKYLTRLCCGNVLMNRVVSIKVSSTWNNDAELPHQLANGNWNDSWCSKNGLHSWIIFDFGSMLVSPSHYSLRSASPIYPRSWELAGSNCCESWIALDHRETDSLAGNRGRVFACESCDEFFRYLRVQQNDNNCTDKFFGDVFCLSEVELFGSVSVVKV